MGTVSIDVVTRDEVPMLHAALARLSTDMGDTHRATQDDLLTHGFGPDAAFRALLARDGEVSLGVLVCTPVFSTVFGGRGLYVSDLWVAPDQRGRALGTRLLAYAVATWEPLYLRLAVYDANTAARRFYDTLGFAAQDGETAMILHGDALGRLRP